MYCHVDPTHSHAVYRTLGDYEKSENVILPVCLYCTEVGIDSGVFPEEALVSMPRREDYGDAAES